MKFLLHVAVLVSLVLASTRVHAEPEKVAIKDLRELPFCATESNWRLDPKTHEIFDELRASFSSTRQTRFRISGKKKFDTGRIGEQTVWHLGKLVLAPPVPRTGVIEVAKVERNREEPQYFVSFELASGHLKSEKVVLEGGTTYTWELSNTDDITNLVIKDGATSVHLMSALTKDVHAFGFATTVRFVNDEAELNVTFD